MPNTVSILAESSETQHRATEDPGVTGNARLTGTVAIILVVLLAVLGGTILSIHRLLPAHFFVGFLVLPVVLLKMASTGYRFFSYYLGNPRYRAAGPPQLFLRLLAPIVVLSTVVVFATGIELWLVGRAWGDVWLRLHQQSFFVWFGATGLHVLGYLQRAPALALADFAPGTPLRGRASRRYAAGITILLGVLLAVIATQWTSPFVVYGER